MVKIYEVNHTKLYNHIGGGFSTRSNKGSKGLKEYTEKLVKKGVETGEPFLTRRKTVI